MMAQNDRDAGDPADDQIKRNDKEGDTEGKDQGAGDGEKNVFKLVVWVECHEIFPFSMDGLYIKGFLREQDLFVRLEDNLSQLVKFSNLCYTVHIQTE